MSSYASHATLRDQAFRAPENHGTPASFPTSTSNPLIRPVLVYSLPADRIKDRETMEAFHLFLIVCGTSDETRREDWQNYVATLVCTCFPSMKTGILANPLYQERILSQGMVDAIKGWYDDYTMATAEQGIVEEAVAREARRRTTEAIIDIELPRGEATFDVSLDDSLEPAAIYGHFSIVLFLAGKTVTDTNRPAITQKRPGALERKYFGGTVVGPLSGSLRLSTVAHSQIHSAFVYLSHLRREVFTKVAQFNNLPGDPAIEIVATTTRLMRYSGMQQAVMIDSFLSAHEEAFRIPILMPAIQAYTASMRDLMSSPAEQRPYYKLIHGDTTRAFNRNDLMNLIVVAVSEARETNPTIQQYAIPPNHQLIMDKYIQTLEHLAGEE